MMGPLQSKINRYLIESKLIKNLTSKISARVKYLQIYATMFSWGVLERSSLLNFVLSYFYTSRNFGYHRFDPPEVCGL